MKRLFIASAALAFAFGLTTQATAGDDAERTAQLCAEAQKRYEGLEDIPKPTGDGTAVVLLYMYNFCPGTLTVKKGTTVHFLNVDKRTSHSVWFKEAGKEESERFFPDEGIQMTFEEPGTYPYLCGPHWEQEGMKAQLTVTE